MEALLFTFAVALAFVIALVVVLAIPAAYGFLGIAIARRLSKRWSWIAVALGLSIYMVAPIAFWTNEWRAFQKRCEFAQVTPVLAQVTSSVRGLAFDLGYPVALAAHLRNTSSPLTPSDAFYEKKLDRASFAFDLGDKVFERCRWPKGSIECESVSSLQSEFLVRGGEVVASELGQYESVLEVVRLSDGAVIAERRVLLFGGGVLGLFLGFAKGSQHLACAPGTKGAFPWIGRTQTRADWERRAAIIDNDLRFVRSVVRLPE
jgi:hypothetical protein